MVVNKLPSIDVSATKHLAFALDAFVYYLRTQASKKVPQDEQKFFVRSESIVTSGAVEKSVFTTPLREALPLAERPDQLRPGSSRSALFGMSTSGLAARTPPRHLGLSGRLSSPPANDILTPLVECAGSNGGSVSVSGNGNGSTESVRSSITSSISATGTLSSGINVLPSLADFGPDTPNERWNTITGLFVRMFGNDVGAERESFLADLGGFRVREERFRSLMDDLKRSLPDSSASDVKLQHLERPRLKLLAGTIKQLNAQFSKRNRNQLPLCCRTVKVSFKDEPGEGSGVARSFYAAVGEALLQPGSLPTAVACSGEPSSSRSTAPASLKRNVAKLEVGNIVEIFETAPEEKRHVVLQWLVPLVNKQKDVKTKAEAAAASEWIVDAVSESSAIIMLAVGEVEDVVIAAALQAVREERTAVEKRNDNGAPATKPTDESKSATSCSNDGSPAKRVKLGNYQKKGQPRFGLTTVSTPLQSSTSADDSLATRFPSSDDPIDKLLHCPGKPSFFCPVPGKWTSFRLAWFRTLGRLMGLSVMHNDIFPITFTRPVLKFILGRKVAWHDLAFFDPELFETLRKTVVAGTSLPSTVESWELTFIIDLPEWMGSGSVELIPDGANVAVTSANVRKYVELYGQHLMVEVIRPALVAMRAGILDALPSKALEGLTAEDFRLLLNGCHAIDVDLLERCTEFMDETGRSGSLMQTTRGWFWEVVRTMSTEEQHDLVYFWTSSPSLPATEAGLVPRPKILVRPASDGDAGLLPTANTCISRLSIPAYPTKEILKDKLLMAIQTKTFGFV